MTSSPTTYGDFLKTIDTFYDENLVQAYCPIRDVTIDIKPLTVDQIRTFIELQVSSQRDAYGVISGLKVANYFNEVLEQNISDKELLKELYILDRDAIIVQLRKCANGLVTFTDNDGQSTEVNLSTVVKSIKDVGFNKKLLTSKKTIKYKTNNVVLEVNLPTVARDSEVNKDFYRLVKNKYANKSNIDESKVDKILSEIFFVELCKYIDLIRIDGGNDIEMSFTDRSIRESVDILSKLPSKVITELSSYMQSLKDYRDSVYCYTDPSGESVPFEINSQFFTGI